MFISEEKALIKIQELLDAGVDKDIVATGLAGLDSDRAWQIRDGLLNAGADKASVVMGLAALDSDRAWQKREEILEILQQEQQKIERIGDAVRNKVLPKIYDAVAISLVGLDSDRAWQIRKDILGSTNTATSLVGLDSERAWQMREEFLEVLSKRRQEITLKAPGDSESFGDALEAAAITDLLNAILVSLIGLDSDRAWQMRLKFLGDSTNVVTGIVGLNSEKAWQARVGFLNAGTTPGPIAESLAGLDSDMAWRVRKSLFDIGVNNSIAVGLAGLDSDRAWQMRKKLLDAGADKGCVALGISGDYMSFSYRLKAKEKEMDEGGRDDFPRTYVVYDLETTGLDPMIDEAIEIGALSIKDGEEPVLKTWLLKPSIPVTLEISNITGITQDNVERFGRDPIECWREFVEFTGINRSVPLYPLVGHNIVGFDNAFTERAIKNMGLSLANVKCIDTAAIYKGRMMNNLREGDESHEVYAKRILETRVAGLKFNLKLVYGELGGPEEKAHCVEGDVKMTNFVYRKMAKLN